MANQTTTCQHQLAYHSEHKASLIIYCTRCNAQWEAERFIEPHADDEPIVYTPKAQREQED